jgi:hypothetical protein
MPRDKCFIFTDEKTLAAAVAEGRMSEHDAAIIRQFAEFLAQAPPPPPLHRKPLPEDR